MWKQFMAWLNGSGESPKPSMAQSQTTSPSTEQQEEADNDNDWEAKLRRALARLDQVSCDDFPDTAAAARTSAHEALTGNDTTNDTSRPVDPTTERLMAMALATRDIMLLAKVAAEIQRTRAQRTAPTNATKEEDHAHDAGSA